MARTSNLKEIYADVEKIYARKGEKSLWPGQAFKHAFDGGVRMLGVMKDGRYKLHKGNLVLKSLSGKQLWENFEYKSKDEDEVKTEKFLTNPPGVLMVLGGNPPKKLRRKRSGVGARKRKFRIGRAGSRHRPVAYTVEGRWKVSPKAHIAKRGAIVNPLGETLMTVGGNPMASRYYHYYRRKENPVKLGLRGITDVKQWAPLAVWGALSATATGAVPAMLGLRTPWMKIGGQLATAFMGGMLVSRTWSKEAGNIWAVVGTSLIVYDLLKTWVFARYFPMLAGPEYNQYETDSESQRVGQYPENEVGAFPEEVSAYPEEVGAYPYDGDYPN